MEQKTDVVIIGAGAIGICTAYYLNRAGASVTVLDQGNVASGSSSGNAGMIVPSHVIPLSAPGVIARGIKWMFDARSPFYIKPRLSWDLISWLLKFRSYCNPNHVRRSIPILHELGQAGLHLFDELTEIEDLEFGYKRKGLLLLCRTEAGLEEARHEAELVDRAGQRVSILNADEASALNPETPAHVKGAVYFQDDTHLDPAGFVHSLAGYIEKQGVSIHQNTGVRNLQPQSDGSWRIETLQGSFPCGSVLLATGAWTPDLARRLGIRIPVQGAKGYSMTFEPNGPMPSVPTILSEARVTVTPIGNRVRVAGTLELCGTDLSINQRRVEGILNALPQYFKSFAPEEARTVDVWSGLRPCTPDGLPILGQSSEVPNLFVATGHAMIGMTLAPISGLLMSEIMTGTPPSIDLTPFKIERF